MKSFGKSITTAAVLGATAQLFAGAAMAAADLQVSNLKVLSGPLQGNCNTVTMTVKNVGVQTSPGTKGAIVTFPQGASNTQRSVRKLYIPRLRPGASRTMSVSKISILPLGKVTIQGVVNAPQTFAEINTANNFATTNVNVIKSCQLSTPVVDNTNGCDLKLSFVAPTGTVIPKNGVTEFKVEAKNQGSSQCPNLSVRLYRYSGNTASGYGTAVGGTSGSIRQIPALNPGQAQELEWAANPSGATGTFTFATKLMSAHNDADNSNHRPKKTVVAQ